MEELSAFAVYNLNKSKLKSKKKKLENSKAKKETKEIENHYLGENEIKKQEMINKIISSQFKQKKKTNNAKENKKKTLIQQILEEKINKKNLKINLKKKNSNSVAKLGRLGTPQIKKQKFSTSTPLLNKQNDLSKIINGKTKHEEKVDESSEHSGEDLESESEVDKTQNKSNQSLIQLNGKDDDDSEVCSDSEPIDSVPKNRLVKTGNQKKKLSTTELFNHIKANKKASAPQNNSIKDGETLFRWLIAPMDLEKFYSQYWEKSQMFISRSKPEYYSKLISFNTIDQMLLNNHVEFTKNIDLTKYDNGIRTTLNPEGRALPGEVWDHYADGCSIRLLNPQTFIPSIFSINSTLQEYFHCMVGANVYLTPPNSQGFAPHYDDIEAFVVQIEGRKHWKVYKPRSEYEKLPRFSSPNYQQNEIGEPILEHDLEPGDILYFPRGFIHQANTIPGNHSLHITFSVYQKQSYADLFEKMFPLILEKAVNDNVDLRKGLPLNIWNNMGIAYMDNKNKIRTQVIKHVRECLHRAINDLPIDDALDQLAKKYQHEALPPQLAQNEINRTVFGCKNYLNNHGEVLSSYKLTRKTNIRLLRAHILRLIREENTIRLYFYTDNSKEYQEYEPNFMEIDPNDVPAVEALINTYPKYIQIKDLPLKDDNRKLEVCLTLWDRGLIMSENAFL